MKPFTFHPRLLPYIQLMRLDKPIGLYVVLWPTLWALWVSAEGIPPLFTLLIFVAGVVVMRSAGCVINDLIDRKFDGHVQRTQQRPLVTGAASVFGAIVLFVALLVIALGLVWQLNVMTIILAFGALAATMTYPLMKRYIDAPQLILGIAFSFAILMAFSATQEYLPLAAWLLFFANILWTISYDTMYAMVDKEDDEKIGIKSSARWFAKYDRAVIALLQSMVIGLFYLLSQYLRLGQWFDYCLISAAGVFIYQQILIFQRHPKYCFQAFVQGHWFGAIIFIGLLGAY